MNIYTCWYRGNLGYGCRRRGQIWMFVPEFGQTDSYIYKNLSLDDLIFKNPADKHFEKKREEKSRTTPLLKILQYVFNSRDKAQSVAGELLTRY